MKVSITKNGVYVGGNKITNVVSADVVNLSQDDPAEVILRIVADEVEVDHKWLGSGDELRQERENVRHIVLESVLEVDDSRIC